MGMLKKAASGVPWLCRNGLHRYRRHFAAFGLTDLSLFTTFALTYWEYAPRVKMAAALLNRPFGKAQGMHF